MILWISDNFYVHYVIIFYYYVYVNNYLCKWLFMIIMQLFMIIYGYL